MIAIYAEPGCAGPEVATGSAVELENSGIQVTVAPGSITTFSATDTDLGGVSGCSNEITYRQVTAPPNPPAVTAVNPSSPANDNAPHVIGSAEAGSTVSIYTDPSCSSAVLGTGTAAAFSEGGIPASVPDNSTTTFYAAASWAGLASACSSSSVTYQEITVAPQEPGGGGGEGGGGAPQGSSVGPGRPAEPKFHMSPGGRSNDPTPLVVGSAPGAGRVDIYRNSACTGSAAASGSGSQLAAGIAVQVAENATTRIYVRAVDAQGNASDCSEPVLYTEDSTPPRTQITFGPGSKTRRRAQVIRFADVTEDPPGTTFSCKLDRRPWGQCGAPWHLSHLRRGAHTIWVKATDAAGNQEPVGAKYRFKVIAARP